MTIEQKGGWKSVELRIWAVPNIFSDGEPYEIQVYSHSGKPFNTGSFLMGTMDAQVPYPDIEDSAPRMIESIEEDIEKAEREHGASMIKLKERIAELRCLGVDS